MTRSILKLFLFWQFALAAAPAAAAERLRLDGDVLSTVAVPRGGAKGSDLAVFLAETKARAAGTLSARKLVWFAKDGAKLKVASSVAIPNAAVGWDLCKLGAPDGPPTVVLLRPDGVYPIGSETPVIRTPTLFLYRAREEFPRLRLCFELAPDAPQLVVLPVTEGLALYRAGKRVGTVPQIGELRPFGQPIRGDDLERTQRFALRIDFAEVSFLDFDGDGRKDLCLAADERVACHLQNASGGFAATPGAAQAFSLLSEAERKDQSLRIYTHFVELTGDGKADLVIRKSRFSVTDMESTLYVHHQKPGGTFATKADQTLSRKGYFNYQEWLDLDADGKTDLVAPVADLGWSELMGIVLSRRATIEFVWFKNQGGKLAEAEALLHTVKWPVDFKNFNAILGALPLWATRFGAGKRALFFGDKQYVEVMRVTTEGGGVKLESEAKLEAEIGAEATLVDLDADGKDELVMADPRDPQRASSLVYLTPP